MKQLNFNLNEFVKIEELKEDVNLFLYNNNLANLEDLKECNKLFEVLKDAKIQFYYN